MSKDNGEKKKDDLSINLDLGFGGILKGLGHFIDTIADMEQGEKKQKEASSEINIGGKKGKMMYGFSVKLGDLGKTEFTEFGNIRQTKEGPVFDEVREPLVDIFEEAKEIKVVVEMPGVEEEDIQIEVKDSKIILHAVRGERKYEKEIDLPTRVSNEKPVTSYKNGILTISLLKGQEDG